MKTRDYVLFGSVGAISAGAEGVVNWINENEDYYEVGDNEAIELVAMGVSPADGVERTIIRDKDRREWLVDGFFTPNDVRLNELPFDNMKDFTNIIAPVSPEVTIKRPVTLKMSSGDKLRVYLRASAAVSGTSYVVAVVRKHISQNAKEQAQLETFSRQFGGLDSNAQYYEIIGSLDSTTVNRWNDIIELTLLKRELYAFSNLGIYPADHLLKTRVMIDDTYEYNQFLTSPNANMLPFVEDVVPVPVDPTQSAAYTSYGMAKKRYVFKDSIVISKNINKNLRVQVMDDGTAISADAYAALRGVRYKL